MREKKKFKDVYKKSDKLWEKRWEVENGIQKELFIG